MEIQRVKINHQGYDASGSYWGTGPKLYRRHDPHGRGKPAGWIRKVAQ